MFSYYCTLYSMCTVYTIEELKWSGTGGINLHYTGGGDPLVYITSRRRTVWLGLLQGVNERFPIQPHRQECTHCTAEGPSSVLSLWCIPKNMY